MNRIIVTTFVILAATSGAVAQESLTFSGNVVGN